jgi:hypothetical protein
MHPPPRLRIGRAQRGNQDTSEDNADSMTRYRQGGIPSMHGAPFY